MEGSMKKLLGVAASLIFLLSGWAVGQDKSAVVILAEPGFPAADSAVASPQQLASWVPGAQLACCNDRTISHYRVLRKLCTL
jgi:hypothetical protein